MAAGRTDETARRAASRYPRPPELAAEIIHATLPISWPLPSRVACMPVHATHSIPRRAGAASPPIARHRTMTTDDDARWQAAKQLAIGLGLITDGLTQRASADS